MTSLTKSKAAFAGALFAGAGMLGATGQADAAGLADATSTYMTIQPNAAGTHVIYTLSWVAPDTDNNGDGLTEGFVGGFGNASAELDRAGNLEGGNLSTLAGQDVQYIYNGTNTVDRVQWTDPANYAVGDTNPAAISREWINIGGVGSDIWSSNIQAYGSGEGGVTGTFSGNPDGTDTATGTGVGVVYDYDSSSSTGFGFLLSGVSDTPNTGYIQVSIPNPTTTWRSPTTGEIDFGAYTYDASHPFLTGNLIGAAGNTDQFITGTYTTNSAVELVVTTDATYTPKLAVSGDLDSDLDVDNVDVGTQSGNFTGSTGSGQWYADGDMDADGDIDNADIGVLSGNFTGGAAVSRAGNLTDTVGIPDLIYDPATGNVTIDTEGLTITSFQFENGGLDTFDTGEFISPSTIGGNFFGLTFEEVAAGVIGDSDPLFVGFTGTFDMGDFMPTGLDQAGLESYLSTAFWGTQGAGSGSYDLIVTVIPEPGSLILLGLGGMLIAGRRRAAA